MNRVGILGGTFDPIHYGHLRLAEEAREQLGLDQVLFVPARISPFKTETKCSPAEDRLEMVRLAIGGNPHFAVSRVEIDRDGPSRTTDTLRELMVHYPRAELYALVGADAVATLPKWHEAKSLIEMAKVVAFRRGEITAEGAIASLPPPFRDRIVPAEMMPLAISATDLRRRAEAGYSLRYLTPDPVIEYLGASRRKRDNI